MSETHPVTRFLIATNVLVFFAGIFYRVQPVLIDRYGFSMQQVAMQHWDVFITAGFLHSDVAHLLYNMFFLWVFGRVCEDVFGWSKTVTIYVSSLIVGSLFFGLLFPTEIAIGASGAVSGLVAAAILVEPGRDIYPIQGSMPIVVLAVLFLIPTVLNAFNLAGGTANIAHVGGAFSGAALALLWQPERSIKNMRELWVLWAGIALVVVLVVVQAV